MSPAGHQQSGTALVMVLWVTLILALILAGAFSAVRIQANIARAETLLLQAELAAYGGLSLAAFELATARQARPAFPMEIAIEGSKITIDWSPEMQKLDINLASEQAFVSLLTDEGLDPVMAEQLAAQIADWRDRDDLSRVNGAERLDYANAPPGKQIGNRAFYSIQELSKVLDMNDLLLNCLRPKLTIYGTSKAGPDSTHSDASPQRYATIPGARLSLIATVDMDDDRIAPQTYHGVFRIIGSRTKAVEWIRRERFLAVEVKAESCTP